MSSLEANQGTMRGRGLGGSSSGDRGCIPGTWVRWGCLPLEAPQGLKDKVPWS